MKTALHPDIPRPTARFQMPLTHRAMSAWLRHSGCVHQENDPTLA